MATKKNNKKNGVTVEYRGNLAATVHHVHGEYVRECAYCGKPMTRSDVNDYGSLCERCYMREYYGR